MAWIGLWATLAACAALAIFETGRLVGAVVVGGGTTTYPATTLSGPTHIFRQLPAVTAWSDAACHGLHVQTWLGWWVGLDGLFILAYGMSLALASRRWDLKIGGLTVALVVADVLEDVLSAVVVRTLGDSCAIKTSTGLPVYQYSGVLALLSIATLAKWLLVLAIGVTCGYRRWFRDCPPKQPVSLWRAALHQRFVLIVALALMVLLVIPGVPILEQGVDAERSWLLSAKWTSGLGAMFAAVLGTMLLWALLWYLAGVHAALPPAPKEPRSPHQGEPWCQAFVSTVWESRKWGFAAGAVAVVAAVLWVTRLAAVYWRPIFFGLGLLLVVPLVSAALALISPPEPPDRTAQAQRDQELRERSLPVGRFLAWSVLVTLAVSVSRAYVQPMLIAPNHHTRCALVVVIATISASGLVFLALSLPAPKLLEAPTAESTSPQPLSLTTLGEGLRPQRIGAADGHQSVGSTLLSVVLWAVLTVVIGGPLVFWPMHVSNWLGVVGGVTVSLAALTGFYTTLVIAAQRIDPPYVFQLLRLRRTPVIGLLLVNGLLVTFWGSDTPLHNIRNSPQMTASRPSGAALSAARLDLTTAVAQWLARSTSCAVDAEPAAAEPVTQPSATSGPVAPRYHVRPMIFVAAEGGGIRAAWWTVDAMVALTHSTCGADSVFLTSGVSGGATGLALMEASSVTPYDDAKKLAGPDALAVGTDALLTRDLIAGSFGVNARAFDRLTGKPFPDRAGLAEQVWANDSAALTAGFLPTPADRPWFTVLNGTSVDHKCRVLVSDIVLGAGKTCSEPNNAVPGAYDLFSAQPCYGSIDGATAQLLAARFPYITPSGRIPDCGGGPGSRTDQIIDGGYAENSGLATINGVLTRVMPMVRDQNQRAVVAAKDTSASDVTLVVPMVVFLHNSVTVSTGVAAQPKSSPELFIPPLDGLSSGGVVKATSTLLATSDNLTAGWAPGPAALDPTEVAAINQAFARTMTVAPQQYPQMALPLGWTLSQATRDSMDQALREYLKCEPGTKDGCTQSCQFDRLISALGDPLSFPPDPAKPGTGPVCRTS